MRGILGHASPAGEALEVDCAVEERRAPEALGYPLLVPGAEIDQHLGLLDLPRFRVCVAPISASRFDQESVLISGGRI